MKIRIHTLTAVLFKVWCLKTVRVASFVENDRLWYKQKEINRVSGTQAGLQKINAAGPKNIKFGLLKKKKTFISLHKPCLTNIVPTLQESEMHRFLTEASPLLEVHVSKKTGISVPSLPVGDLHSSSPEALLHPPWLFKDYWEWPWNDISQLP